jgi:3-methyladenine DNA glycosylase AlkD
VCRSAGRSNYDLGVDVERWADEVDQALRAAGTADRAAHEKAYLKSELMHYGVRVPAVRAAVHAALSREPACSHDDVIALALALWAEQVHERRSAAAEMLASEVGQLGPADLPFLETLLRGWVLRETAKKRPATVADWVAPRVRRMSGVTFREAIKPLDEQQRSRLVTARRAETQV